MTRPYLILATALSAPLAAQEASRNEAAPPAAAPAPTPAPAPVPSVVIPLPTLTPVPTPTPTPSPRVSPSPSRADSIAVPTPARSTATPAPTPSATRPTLATAPPPDAAPTSAPVVAPQPIPAAPARPPSSVLPVWAIPLGLLLLAGAAGAIALWRRRRERSRALPAPAAAPVPEPVAPAGPSFLAPPPPAPPTERARLTVTLRPRRAGVNLATATADVTVAIVNHGSAPARGVRVAVTLLSARGGQDDELGRLFAEPIARPAVTPFGLAAGETREVTLLATLPRASVNVLDAGGRPMFVPIVAVNVVYEIGGGALGQVATAWAIGIVRDGVAKLGPFWLDRPNRMHDRLGVRPHALSIES